MKRVPQAVAGVVLVASGAYVFIYLYRWEWNRALIAGVFFLAALIALVAAVIVERLKRIEGQLSELKSGNASPDALERIKESAFEPHRPFAWLTNDSDEMNVFVPVLLGAGIVLSAIAWVVERVALATARPLLEGALAQRLATLGLPEGGLTETAPVSMPSVAVAKHSWKPVVVAVVATLTLWVAIDQLGEMTQNREDKIVPGTYSSVTLEIDLRSAQYGETATAAESLWGMCRTTVPGDRVGSIRELGNGTARFDVTPAVGYYGAKRLHGCLEDALLPGVQASVVSIGPRS